MSVSGQEHYLSKVKELDELIKSKKLERMSIASRHIPKNESESNVNSQSTLASFYSKTRQFFLFKGKKDIAKRLIIRCAL